MAAPADSKTTGKHLVILGCGYIGTAVALAALGRSWKVTALTRNLLGAAALADAGAQTVVADLAENGWHAKISGPVTAVLDCVGSGGNDAAAYRHSYFDGMESLLAWVRRIRGVDTVIYTSSTSVYAQGDGAVVDETFPVTPANERAGVLVATEELLRDSATGRADPGAAEPMLPGAGEAGDFSRWFILRLAGIYGPEREHLATQVTRGSVAGRGDHHLNLVHRDDVVGAVLAGIDAPEYIANEIFNVVDDAPALKRDVVSWLAQRENLPMPVFTGTAAPGRSAVVPDRIISNMKLKRVLGWSPRYPSFREGYSAEK